MPIFTEKSARLPCLMTMCGNEDCCDDSLPRLLSLGLKESAAAAALVGGLQYKQHTHSIHRNIHDTSV